MVGKNHADTSILYEITEHSLSYHQILQKHF